MPRENKTQYAILGCLSKQQWMTGYDIKHIMEKISASYWVESNAQLYPLLKKLYQDEMLVMKEDNEGPRKRYLYKITEKGKHKLLKWLMTPSIELPTQRNEWLLKLSLGHHLDQSKLLEHLENYLEKITKRKEKLSTTLKTINNVESENTTDQTYLKATYRFGELTLNAQMTWCKEMIEHFKVAVY